MATNCATAPQAFIKYYVIDQKVVLGPSTLGIWRCYIPSSQLERYPEYVTHDQERIKYISINGAKYL